MSSDSSGECSSDADCGTGLHCVTGCSNSCQPGCLRDSECKDGKRCDVGFLSGLGQCVDPPSPGRVGGFPGAGGSGPGGGSKPASLGIHVAPDGNDSNDGSPGKPLRTLEAALAAVAGRYGPAVIRLCGDLFPRDKPLVIGPEQTPTPGFWLLIDGCSGYKPVLSGGVEVSAIPSDLPGVFEITVPEGASPTELWAPPGAAIAPLLRRSRHPNFPGWDGAGLAETQAWIHGDLGDAGDSLRVVVPQSFPYNGAPTALLPGPSDPMGFAMELVVPLAGFLDRYPIQSHALVDTANGPVAHVALPSSLATAAWNDPFAWRASSLYKKPSRFWIEGNMPDLPGEYAYSKALKKILLRADEPPGPLFVPSGLETLVVLDGVQNVELHGISFRHTTRKGSGDGFLGFDGLREIHATDPGDPGKTSLSFPPAAVVIQNAQNITLTGCEFQDLGSAGLLLGDPPGPTPPPYGVQILGTRFVDIAGPGVVSEGAHLVSLANNVFRRIGLAQGANALSILGGSWPTVSRNVFRQIGGRAILFGALPPPGEELSGSKAPLDECIQVPTPECVEGIFFPHCMGGEISSNRVEEVALQVAGVGAIHAHTGGFLSPVQVTLNYLTSIRGSTFFPEDTGANHAFHLGLGSRSLHLWDNVITRSDRFARLDCQRNNTIEKNHTVALEGEEGVAAPCPEITCSACHCIGASCFDVLTPLTSPLEQSYTQAGCTPDPNCTPAEASLCASGEVFSNENNLIAAQIKAQAGLDPAYSYLDDP